ncbi:hypothetical protein PMIN03_000953 [Paraphaeosphaeria minitans]
MHSLSVWVNNLNQPYAGEVLMMVASFALMNIFADVREPLHHCRRFVGPEAIFSEVLLFAAWACIASPAQCVPYRKGGPGALHLHIQIRTWILVEATTVTASEQPTESMPCSRG